MERNDSSQVTGHSSQNCAALLTPPGAAAIAVVRIVGPSVVDFLQRHFDGAPRPGRPAYGRLSDVKGTIDDCVVVLSEDRQVADINLHGGAWVVKAALDLAAREGFEIQKGEAGVAPTIAIDANSEIEREILAYLPLATTELALRSLLAQERAWSELLSKPIEQDTAERILADRSLHWLVHPPRVAIVGAPNVGKSTLANCLFAQERSITADVPGTTRDWVGEMANLNGLAVQLVDTPGLRETNDAIEAQAIRQSAAQIQAADLVILVLDASRSLEPEQSPLLEGFSDAIRVVNKCDLPRRCEVSGIETVATSGNGVDELVEEVLARFDNPHRDPDRARCWTERQRDLLITSARNPGSSQG